MNGNGENGTDEKQKLLSVVGVVSEEVVEMNRVSSARFQVGFEF